MVSDDVVVSVYSGYWGSAQAYRRSVWGRYWASSAGNYINSSFLGLSVENVFPADGSYQKYMGYSVRCVAGS